jgi:AcrR family transcriptional regulator
MAAMATRRYEQRLRAEAAEETRRRILDAVYRQLREAPSEQISIDKVARIAEVARSTVYQVFGSRPGLFDALGADVLRRGGFEKMTQAALHPDARQGLRGTVQGCAELYAKDRDVVRALFSMAVLDPDAAGVAIRNMEKGRASGMARLAQRLADQGVLREDLTVADATDILWLLTGFDSFDALFTGRQRSLRRTAHTLTAMAEQTLCR